MADTSIVTDASDRRSASARAGSGASLFSVEQPETQIATSAIIDNRSIIHLVQLGEASDGDGGISTGGFGGISGSGSGASKGPPGGMSGGTCSGGTSTGLPGGISGWPLLIRISAAL